MCPQGGEQLALGGVGGACVVQQPVVAGADLNGQALSDIVYADVGVAVFGSGAAVEEGEQEDG